MAKQLDSLAAEIDRTIAAPYAVSLKILDNIIKECGSLVVKEWADLHSEKIKSLITIVLEGLQLWPYTLGLLENLVAVPALRESALSEAPALLHDLLERANRSKQGFNEASKLCISLMSKRLPETVALPALAQSFFVKVFEIAVREPSIDTVEPVYILLRGACKELLEILPQSSLDDFRDHLTRMMRIVKSIDDQLLSLFCLAAIARVNTQHLDPHTVSESLRSDALSQESSHRAPSTRTRDEVQRFYSGERASKTMHLLALQVIYACRGDHTISQTTTIKHVRLAREVASAVDSTARHTWAKGNPAIVRKLYEKVTQTPLYHAVQLEALCFITTLCDIQSVPSGCIVAYQEALMKAHTLYIDEESLNEIISLSLGYYISRLSDSFWQSLLRTFLLTVSGSEDRHVQQHRALATLLKHLQTLCGQSHIARSGIVHALYSENVACMVDNITTAYAAADPPTRGSLLIRELDSNLITLLLSAVLSQQSEGRPQQETALTMKLLERQRQLATFPTQLDHHLRRDHITTSIFERPCTQNERGASVQWREKLAVQLQMDAFQRQESVARFVGQLCRDLEERCEDIEEPLRQEKTSHEQTRQRYHDLEGRIVGLEDQIDGKNDTIAELRRSKDSIENEFEAHQTEADLIKQKALDLENRLLRATEEFQRDLKESDRRHESVKLEIQASLACRTEQMDDQEDEIKALRTQVEQITKLRVDEKVVSEQEGTNLRERLKAAETKMESDLVIATRKAEDMARMTVEADGLNQTIESMRTKTQQLESEIIQFKATLSETEQSSRQKLQELNEAHLQHIAKLEQEMLSLRQDIKQKSETFETELERINVSYEKKINSRDVKIQELRKKGQALAAESFQKSRELEEAQKMKAGLMSALGLNYMETAPPAKITNREARITQPVFNNSQASDIRGGLESDGDDQNLVESQSECEESQRGQAASSPAFEHIAMRTKPRATAFKQPSMRRKSHVGTSHEMAERTDTIKKRRALRQSVPNLSSPKRQGTMKPPGWAGLLNNFEPNWERERPTSGHSPSKTPGRVRIDLKNVGVGAGKENHVPATPHGPIGTYGTDLAMDDFDATTVEF